MLRPKARRLAPDKSTSSSRNTSAALDTMRAGTVTEKETVNRRGRVRRVISCGVLEMAMVAG